MSITLEAKRHIEERAFALQRARIEFETSAEPAALVGGATAGGDSRKLRGLPAIARSVTGAIEGTTAGTDAHVERLSR